jgi:hypothetical protein
MKQHKPKVLIGTPIHELKDYCLERWLQNVSKLRQVYPCDFLMVDNSPSLDYIKKVKGYCKKLGIKDYQIKHLEIPQGKNVNKNIDEQIHERVALSQEIIRQFTLKGDYDAWFSWECDQIIPTNALEKLVEIMKMGNFMMVNHNIWDKNVSDGLCYDWGITLVSKDYLKKYGFLLEYGTNPEPDSWYNAEAWYRQRLKRDGAPFIDLTGVIEPILHL